MARSDTTTSSTPFSPFSYCSAASEATSDDPPDLGAFTDVFRALNEFQQEPRTAIGIPIPITQLDHSHRTPTSSLVALSPVTTGYNVTRGRTGPYFLSNPWRDELRPHARSLSPRVNSDNSDLTEGEELFPETVEVRSYDFDSGVDFLDEDGDQPSLGYLDEALGFIAAERAKFFASRDVAGGAASGNRSSTSDSAFRAIIQARKKRRRKKVTESHSQGPLNRISLALDRGSRIEDTAGDPSGAGDATLEDTSSSFEASSSPAKNATPVTARGRSSRKKGKNAERTTTTPPLLHSRSTPSLRLTTKSLPLDPRVLRLRALAHKLRLLFPEDAARLSSILSNDQAEEGDFVDPRGPKPRSKDTLIHVFVDHSNILIGFLTYLRRHPAILAGRPKRLSHAALALILERGRSVTRRFLATSSPLYQPMELAMQLGYEVRIYARVPDMGDGMDRNPQPVSAASGNSGSSGENGRSSSSHKSNRNSTGPGITRTMLTRGHARQKSAGVMTTSENSDSATTGLLSAPARSESAGAVSSGSPASTPGGSTARVRYREQGVDELLQLKLHQAIADVDVVPPNATIVLATGDGNVGQFNEEGFLGCVRTALKKGWRVELYAWEGGLSRSWKREFGEGPYRHRFSIHGLNKFGQDLLEV